MLLEAKYKKIKGLSSSMLRHQAKADSCNVVCGDHSNTQTARDHAASVRNRESALAQNYRASLGKLLQTNTRVVQ